MRTETAQVLEILRAAGDEGIDIYSMMEIRQVAHQNMLKRLAHLRSYGLATRYKYKKPSPVKGSRGGTSIAHKHCITEEGKHALTAYYAPKKKAPRSVVPRRIINSVFSLGEQHAR